VIEAWVLGFGALTRPLGWYLHSEIGLRVHVSAVREQHLGDAEVAARGGRMERPRPAVRAAVSAELGGARRALGGRGWLATARQGRA
jgi:hypothetical protein